MQPLDGHGVPGGHAVAEGFGAPGGRDARGVHEVLGAPGDAVQRAEVAAGGDLRVGPARLAEGQVAREGDDGVDPRLEPLEALQVDPRQALGRERAGLDPAREVAHAGEGDVLVASGQGRDGAGAADESIARGPDAHARQGRVPAAGGREGRIQRDPAGPRAPLVQGRHRDLPVARRLRALGRGVVDLDELLRLRDGPGRDLGAHGGTGAEGGRHAGRRLGRRRRSGRHLRGRGAGQGRRGQAHGGILEERPSGDAHGGIVVELRGDRCGGKLT